MLPFYAMPTLTTTISRLILSPMFSIYIYIYIYIFFNFDIIVMNPYG